MKPSPRLVAAKAEQHWIEETGVILTRHARQRMAEMGVTADQVVDLLANPDVTRTTYDDGRGNGSGIIAVADRYPKWAVVYKLVEDDRKLVASVVFRELQRYDRDGQSYVIR